MIWVYEVINSKTGEIIKVYSKHCITSFKAICQSKSFIYESWYAFINSDGSIEKV